MGTEPFRSFWKTPPVAAKVTRGLKRRVRDNAEDRAKAEVRRRDKGCRFPRCGCRPFGLALHVSHSQHKGAGGNPTGDRSVPRLMVQVCSARHRENAYSIDRGMVRWRALTRKGADGPIVWEVLLEDLRDWPVGVELRRGWRPGWFEVARESAVGVVEPLTRRQLVILTVLSVMSR